MFHDIGKCVDEKIRANGHKQASIKVLKYCADKTGMKDTDTYLIIENIILHTHNYDYDLYNTLGGKILKNTDYRSSNYDFYEKSKNTFPNFSKKTLSLCII